MKPPDDLLRLTALVNMQAFRLTRNRSTCILSSAALKALLEHCGHPAELVRVTVGVFPHGKVTATILGSDGGGQRLPKAKFGDWHGHLIVRSGRFLLDPTLDQVRGLHPQVLYIPDPAAWDSCDWKNPAHMIWIKTNTLDIRYSKFHRQTGWRSAPDMRRSHWCDITSAVLRRVKRG